MRKHLEELKELIEDEKKIYPCIEDLVLHGLAASRFEEGERRPNRQDVTQYLLAWLNSVEVISSDAQEWAIPYCLEVLSVLSASAPSGIRHSTKSNVRYIYEKDVPFVCGLEENPFKAACSRKCPVYSKMVKKIKKIREKEEKSKQSKAIALKARREAAPIVVPKKKEVWADQFQKAMVHVAELTEKGESKKKIVEELNRLGFKTRTGRDWKMGILMRELKMLEE